MNLSTAITSRSVPALALIGVMTLLGGSFVHAQSPEDVQSRAWLQALEDWRSEHGDLWLAQGSDRGHRVSFLYGGRVAAELPVVDEDGVVAAARHFLVQTQGLHRVEPDSLRRDKVRFLPLGMTGSSDKWTVRFTQEYGGYPVRRASVNVLLDATGALLSVDVLNALSPEELPASTALERSEAELVQQCAITDPSLKELIALLDLFS